MAFKKLKKFEPGRIEVIHDEKHLNDVDGDADNFLTKCGLGATTETMVLTRKMRK